ncbi:hypothetical protein [Sphingomonas colocasiae]|uniref:DUF4235 domain-containing protein n=1 Tax=Sphingomonas colocasiae TaxID=1848973 RepID=A0ABS7PRJ8_9SPHN|nr:hypothetical protein [Sphingomonas colocasiae]MBY8823290.1 hypothetical protein [Sphingomonas colocasiae]MBY8826425.1 hypothetical protein [Sphingomonas colocasiae]
MSNWIGALVGAALDRRDGDSGLKGAAIGYAVQGVARVAVPLAVTFAIGWAVQKGFKTTIDRLRNGKPEAGGGTTATATRQAG